MARQKNPSSLRSLQAQHGKKRGRELYELHKTARELQAAKEEIAALAARVEQPAAEPAHIEQPAVEPAHIEQPAVEPARIEQPAVEPTRIEQPAVEPTHIEQPAAEPTRIEQPTTEFSDLEKLLNDVETEEKHPQPDTPEMDSSNAFQGDFEQPAAEPDPQPNFTADGDKTRAGMPPEFLADLLISGLDMLNKIAAPVMYEKAVFTVEERLKMRWFMEKYTRAAQSRSKTISIDEQEAELMTKYMDYHKYLDTLPLTPDERQRLRVPLMQLCANANIRVSPFWAFIFACVIISLPRYAPIFAAKFKRKYQTQTPEREYDDEPTKPETDAEYVEAEEA